MEVTRSQERLSQFAFVSSMDRSESQISSPQEDRRDRSQEPARPDPSERTSVEQPVKPGLTLRKPSESKIHVK